MLHFLMLNSMPRVLLQVTSLSKLCWRSRQCWMSQISIYTMQLSANNRMEDRVLWQCRWWIAGKAWVLALFLQERHVHREYSPITQTTPEPTLAVILGRLTTPKNFPLPLVTLQARSYCTHQATQTLLFAKPFDLAQVCHGNEICSKLVLTCKLTLELSFPAHCISNWKLNGISWTNIRKVTLNVANELPTLQSRPVVRDGPPAGPGGGGKCAVEHESVVQKAPSVWSPYGCRQWLWDLWDRKVLYPGDELVIPFKVLEFAKEAVVWLLSLKILHRSELDPTIFLTFQNHFHQIDLFISLPWQGPEL